MERRSFLALASAMSLPFVRSARAADTIKIGAINPYTGPMALYGNEVSRGYELAIDKANAAGGVIGRQIQLVRGDAANAQQGISVVQQLSGTVDVFVGTYISAVSNAASDTALRSQKVYWDTNALAEELTQRGLPNFIRSGPDANSFAEISVETVKGLIAPALKKELKDLTVWIEHEDSIYGTSIAGVQGKLLQAAGIKVVGVGAHSAGAVDLTDSILRAKRANPDAYVNTGYVPDGNLLLRTARDQGFNPPAILFVGTGDTPETLNSLGAAYMEGLLVVSYPRTDVAPSFGPGAQEYLAAYKKKFNQDPIAPQGMAAYVGLQMLLEAIKSAGGTDMEKLRAAAARMDQPLYTYATGFGAKFDQHFQNIRAFPTTVQWQSGKPATVFPTDAAPAGSKLVPLSRRA